MTTLVAVRLPDAVAAAEVIRRVWATGDAVAPLDPAASEDRVAEALRRLRPSALVHTRPDGSGPKVTRLAGAPVPDGTAAVVSTSGSGGGPTSVVLSAAAMDASAAAGLDRLGCAPPQRWLLTLPLHHVAGLQVLRRARLLGTEPDVAARFDVDRVAASPAGWWALVPTMLARLLDAGADLGARTVLLGGAAAPADLLARARAAGARVVTSYGLTETCGGCVYDGRPLDGVEVAIGAAGRIAVRGPVTATGRLVHGGVEPLTDGDGWLVTADRGRWVDGRLEVLGRLDRVIVTGGENVAPEPVEEHLRTHPAVADAAVTGHPDDEWGERVVALVVPRDPDRPPTLDDLRDHVGGLLGAAAAPRELRIVGTLPRTALGKLARGRLAGGHDTPA